MLPCSSLVVRAWVGVALLLVLAGAGVWGGGRVGLGLRLWEGGRSPEGKEGRLEGVWGLPVWCGEKG